MEYVISILKDKTRYHDADDIRKIVEILSQMRHYKELLRESNYVEYLQRVSRVLDFHTYKKGETLFHLGDKGDKFFMIFQGRIGIFLQKPVKQRENLSALYDKIMFLREELKNTELQNQLYTLQQELELMIQSDKSKWLWPMKDHVQYTRKYWNFDQSICMYRKVGEMSDLESFGQACYLEQNTRSATVIALTELHVGTITGEEYKRIFSNQIENLNFTLLTLQQHFSQAEQKHLHTMNKWFDEIKLNLNNSLFSVGQPADCFYIIKSGQIAVRKKIDINPAAATNLTQTNYKNNIGKNNSTDNKNMVLSILSHGDIIGHQDMFSSGIRTISAESICSETYVCRMNRSVLQKNIQDAGLISLVAKIGLEKYNFYLNRMIQIRQLMEKSKKMTFRTQSSVLDIKDIMAKLVTEKFNAKDKEFLLVGKTESQIQKDKFINEERKQAQLKLSKLNQTDRYIMNLKPSAPQEGSDIYENKVLKKQFELFKKQYNPKYPLKTELNEEIATDNNNSNGNRRSSLNMIENYKQKKQMLNNFSEFIKKKEFFNNKHSLGFELQFLEKATQQAIEKRIISPLVSNDPLVKEQKEIYENFKNKYMKNSAESMLNMDQNMDSLKFFMKRNLALNREYVQEIKNNSNKNINMKETVINTNNQEKINNKLSVTKLCLSPQFSYEISTPINQITSNQISSNTDIQSSIFDNYPKKQLNNQQQKKKFMLIKNGKYSKAKRQHNSEFYSMGQSSISTYNNIDNSSISSLPQYGQDQKQLFITSERDSNGRPTDRAETLRTERDSIKMQSSEQNKWLQEHKFSNQKYPIKIKSFSISNESQILHYRLEPINSPSNIQKDSTSSMNRIGAMLQKKLSLHIEKSFINNKKDTTLGADNSSTIASPRNILNELQPIKDYDFQQVLVNQNSSQQRIHSNLYNINIQKSKQQFQKEKLQADEGPYFFQQY